MEGAIAQAAPTRPPSAPSARPPAVRDVVLKPAKFRGGRWRVRNHSFVPIKLNENLYRLSTNSLKRLRNFNFSYWNEESRFVLNDEETGFIHANANPRGRFAPPVRHNIAAEA